MKAYEQQQSGGLCLRGLSGDFGLGVVRGGAAAGEPPPLAEGGVLAGLAAERVCGGEERSGDLRPPPLRAWHVCACGKTCVFLVNRQLGLVARRSRMLAASPALGARDWVSWDWESGVRRVFLIIPYVRASVRSG